ncbi:hypothetical protein WJX74_007240 [Apatococcus lobatus]|uniref:Uncharacterized protein n=1 Tax=Apatococcus lobatus TaxID=904363 RepID=A0AAW1RCI3_9CHLO
MAKRAREATELPELLQVQQPKPTRSAVIRSEGNRVYKTVTGGLAPCVLEARVQKAVSLYEQAATFATSDDEKASALKNIACCWSKLLELNSSDQQALEASIRAAQAALKAKIYGTA